MSQPFAPRGLLALLERELSRIEALARRDMAPELLEELERLFTELDELQRQWGAPERRTGRAPVMRDESDARSG